LIVFPNVQQLDLTGPYEVFALWPRARVRLIAKTLDPVVSSTRLVLTPDETYAGCSQLDVLCIPGGAGINALLADVETLAFVRRQAEGARFVISVWHGSARARRRWPAERQAGHDPLGVAPYPRGWRRS
jgi:cyclohexyl-isocyanide hydratase